MRTTGSFRYVVTALLVLAVQFCCCDRRSWFCSSERSTAVLTSVDGELGCCGERAGAATGTQKALQGRVADTHGGTEQDGDGKCVCGKHRVQMLTVEKTGVEASAGMPVMFVELPGLELPLIGGWRVASQVYRDDWACMKPPTSLLRQHCALIV